MAWHSASAKIPPDTIGAAALWLADDDGRVIEGGYRRSVIGESLDEGTFIDADGENLAISIKYWRPKAMGEMLPPPHPEA